MKHPSGPLHKGDGVRMLPTDYKRLKPETLAEIKPVTANEVSNDLDEQAVWLYLSEMGINRKTAAEARVGCLTQRFVIPDSKKENGVLD